MFRAFLLILLVFASALRTGESASFMFRPAAGGGGTPAFVAFTSSAAATATTRSVTRTVAAGNTLVVGAVWFDVNVSCTVADGVNTYIGLTLANSADRTMCKLFYAKNVAGGSTTVTMTLGSSQFCKIVLWELSGCSTTAPLDGENTGNGDSANVLSGNVATSQNVEVLVMVCNNFGGFSATPQTSWTEDADVGGEGIEAQHRVTSASGTYSAAATLTGGQNWAVAFAAFK